MQASCLLTLLGYRQLDVHHLMQCMKHCKGIELKLTILVCCAGLLGTQAVHTELENSYVSKDCWSNCHVVCTSLYACAAAGVILICGFTAGQCWPGKLRRC